MSIDIKPHAYDPATQPELFEGVLARRVVAFIVDFVIISIPVVLAAMFIFAFGIVTLGTRLCALLAPAQRDRNLGNCLFWSNARRPGISHLRHARHGP